MRDACCANCERMGQKMVAIKIYELGEIPAGIETFEDFRRWSLSDEFPQRGRIDFINGHIEVDMAPDRINTHSVIVSAIVATLWNFVDRHGLGQVLGSQTRIASRPAELSCEPDIKVVLWESLRSGRVKYAPATNQLSEDDMLEVEGGPGVVVEILSPGSVEKDKTLLPPAYFKAGVREYWLVDALEKQLSFQIQKRGRKGFETVVPDAKGFAHSDVLNQSFRLKRRKGPVDYTWIYNLEHRA